MKKLMKEMSPTCSFYYVHCRSLAERNELRTGERPRWKIELVLEDPPHNPRRDQNADRADYDVLGCNDTKDVAGILGEVMSPRVLVHLLCSAQPFPFWYSAVAFEKRGAQASTRDNSRKSDAMGKNNESVEMQSVF